MGRWWPYALICLVVVLAVLAATIIFQSNRFPRAISLTALILSLASLVVVVVTKITTSAEQADRHRDLLDEQQSMRRGQTRPRVLVYFQRRTDERRRDRLAV